MVKLPDFYQKYIMSNLTQLYSQVFGYLRQYSSYCDLRHLKTLAWMINGFIYSGQLSLSSGSRDLASRTRGT